MNNIKIVEHYTNISLELPDEIRNNESYNLYEVRAQDGRLLAKYERQPNDVSFNVWYTYTKEEIEEINKRELEAKKALKTSKKTDDMSIEERREARRDKVLKDIEAAEKLLQSLYNKTKEND